MTRSILFLSAFSFSLISLATTASAQDAGDTSTRVDRSENPVHIAISFLRPAVAQMGELSAEFNIRGNVAAAVTLGAGPGTIHRMNARGFESDSVACAIAAAHFRYYGLLGSFDRGLFVGAETVVFYMDRDGETTVQPKHHGWWLGPTVGYKYTFSFGLAMSAGITMGVPLWKADGIDPDEVPGGVKEEHPFIGPFLLGPNASVGWAF